MTWYQLKLSHRFACATLSSLNSPANSVMDRRMLRSPRGVRIFFKTTRFRCKSFSSASYVLVFRLMVTRVSAVSDAAMARFASTDWNMRWPRWSWERVEWRAAERAVSPSCESVSCASSGGGCGGDRLKKPKNLFFFFLLFPLLFIFLLLLLCHLLSLQRIGIPPKMLDRPRNFRTDLVVDPVVDDAEL